MWQPYLISKKSWWTYIERVLRVGGWKGVCCSDRLENAFVLHVSLKDFQKEESPWGTIGAWMLLSSSYRMTRFRKTINDIYFEWYAQELHSVMKLLKAGHSKKKTAVFVIDDLYRISQAQGERQMLLAVSGLESCIWRLHTFIVVHLRQLGLSSHCALGHW